MSEWHEKSKAERDMDKFACLMLPAYFLALALMLVILPPIVWGIRPVITAIGGFFTWWFGYWVPHG